MADTKTELLNIDLQNLAAKFVRMGIMTPAEINKMTRERLDYIVAGLPAVYETSFAVRNRKDELLIQRMFDISPEGLNNQIVTWLKKQNLATLPEQKEVNQCTPEAWIGLFSRPTKEVNSKELSKAFKNWGFEVKPKLFEIAFEKNSNSNIKKAMNALLLVNQELIARLVVAGIISPINAEDIGFNEALEILNRLPALSSREIVINAKEDNERKAFIDISEHGLGLQVEKYLLANGLSSDDIVHQGDDIRFGLDWLEYFKQGAEQADPSHNGVCFSLENLDFVKKGDFKTSLSGAVNDFKSRLASYGITEISDKSIHQGSFKIYTQEVLCEAKESYKKRFVALTRKELEEKADDFLKDNKIKKFSKLEISEHAIIKEKSHQLRELQHELKVWNLPYTAKQLETAFSSDVKKIKQFAKLKFSKAIISKTVAAGIIKAIPIEDWKKLDAARATEIINKIPCGGKIKKASDWLKLFNQNKDEEKVKEIESIFKKAKIEFDEEKVEKCFNEKKEETIPMQKRIIFANEQERIALYSLIKKKRIEPISKDDMDSMTSGEAKEIIKEYDVEASAAQKKFIVRLLEEKKIEHPLTEKEIDKLKGHEASVMISSALGDAPTESKGGYVKFASSGQREAIRSYMNRGKIERMELEEWKKLSSEKAQEIISSLSTNDPLTSDQKKAILDLHNKGTIDLSKTINKPVITEKEIDSLSFNEASKLLGENSQAATEKQRQTIETLVKYKKTPELSQDQKANLSKSEASKIISKSPASQAQKNRVSELVKDGKLETIEYETFSKMTSGQASTYIKNGITNTRKAPSVPTRGATEAQLKKLKELYEQGKINELPAKPNITQASTLIAKGVESSIITPNQQNVVRNMIERKQIKEMAEEQIKAMTQGGFAELLRNGSRQEQSRPAECSVKEYNQLAKLVKEGHLEKLPLPKWKSLTKEDANKLIRQGLQNQKSNTISRDR